MSITVGREQGCCTEATHFVAVFSEAVPLPICGFRTLPYTLFQKRVKTLIEAMLTKPTDELTQLESEERNLCFSKDTQFKKGMFR